MSLSSASDSTVRKPHLLFINYYFPPMGGGGVQRITKFLKYIDLRRFDVSVLTVKSSFFYSLDNSLADEIPPAVQVFRSGSLDPFRLNHIIRGRATDKSADKSAENESGGLLRRISMTVFIPDSRIPWLPFALAKFRRIHRNQPIDAIIASMPPFTCGLIGALSSKNNGPPLILDFRDAWTANPYLPHISGLHNAANRRLEAFCIDRAAACLFVNPALAEYYHQQYPQIGQQKISRTIRNGFDPEDFRDDLAPTGSGKFTIGIMGTIYSQGNRPILLLKALKILMADRPDLSQIFRLVFLGKWTPEFQSLVEDKMQLGSLVEFQSYLPHRQALRKASGWDALALAIENDLSGAANVTPGRIYEYLRLKKPILAMAPADSDLAHLVKSSNAGEVYSGKNPQQLAEQITGWLNSPESFHKAYQFENIDQFSRKDQAARLGDFIEAVLRN